MFFITAFAEMGFDLSVYQGDVAKSSFDCLWQAGYRYAIFEAQSKERYSEYCINQYTRARAAGFQDVDLYIFPTIKFDPRQQIKDTIGKLRSGGIIDDGHKARIWVDVENADIWYDNYADNQWFFSEVMEETIAQVGRERVGVYASKTQWDAILGSSYTGYSDFPLWWPRYDENPTLDNFVPFGGFTKPVMKQYINTRDVCGTQLDHNYRPDK